METEGEKPALPERIDYARITEFAALKARFELAQQETQRIQARLSECVTALERDYQMGGDDVFNADVLSPDVGKISRK